MSTCEKCWREASVAGPGSHVDRYEALILERAEHPCTPEQQAGPGAERCPTCQRMTLHQYTSECMVPDCRGPM